MAHTPVDSHLVAMREELSAEELITRAQNAPRNYDQRWSPEILQLVERWAVLNGVRDLRCPTTLLRQLTKRVARAQTHADYLHHWLPAMVFHAMKETRILAWEGFDGDGWPEPPNRTCIVFSESGGGALSAPWSLCPSLMPHQPRPVRALHRAERRLGLLRV